MGSSQHPGELGSVWLSYKGAQGPGREVVKGLRTQNNGKIVLVIWRWLKG